LNGHSLLHFAAENEYFQIQANRHFLRAASFLRRHAAYAKIAFAAASQLMLPLRCRQRRRSSRSRCRADIFAISFVFLPFSSLFTAAMPFRYASYALISFRLPRAARFRQLLPFCFSVRCRFRAAAP